MTSDIEEQTVADADRDDTVVGDDVDWLVDDDGTEFFVEDGVRYDLADDGYAYPVSGPPDDESASEPAVSTVSSSQTQELTPVTSEIVVNGAGSKAARATTDDLLRLEGVTSGYGQLPVLHGVDLTVGAGETAVLLGLNGAGKTTTAKTICGALDTWKGRILLDGDDISGWSTRRCVNAGVVMVPEGRRVFPDLDVARNLQIGAWSQRKDGDWVDAQRERVFGYFPRLRERTAQLAGTLSGGEQQMLAIARGLMANPRLLIIDEASMGLAPVIVSDVFDIVHQINADAVTVLMIEQNVSVLEVADVALVMEQGRIIRELRGDDLRDLDQISEVMMG